MLLPLNNVITTKNVIIAKNISTIKKCCYYN